jgi:CBS domain-containing protein
VTREVRTCSSEDQLVEIMELMKLQRIRHLPVVQNGALQGIVSIGDVVKQRLEEVQSEAEDLRRYIRSP